MLWKIIKRLREERAQIIAEMQAMLKKANDETRDLSDDESGKFDELNRKAEALKSKIEQHEQVAQLEAEQRASEQATAGREDTPPGGNRPDTGDETRTRTAEQQAEQRREAFDRFLRGGLGALSDEQRSMVIPANGLPGMDTRALSTSGIGVVGTREFGRELVKSLKHYAGVLAAGARVTNTSNGNAMTWMTVDDTANTGTLKTESSAAADDNDPTFGNSVVSAYTYDSDIIRVPIELLQDSEVDLAGEILDLAAERIGRALNAHTTTGTGTGQPQGFVTAASVGKTTAVNTAVTYDELIDFVHSVDVAYRRRNPTWQLHDQTLALFRKLKDGDNRYIFVPGASGEPGTLLGYPYVVNNDMDQLGASKNIAAFGDFSRYRVRNVTMPFVARLSERYAEFRQVGFYLASRHDGKLQDTKAVKKLATPA